VKSLWNGLRLIEREDGQKIQEEKKDRIEESSSKRAGKRDEPGC